MRAKRLALMDFITPDLALKSRSGNAFNNEWAEPTDYSLVRGIAIFIRSGVPGDGYGALQWAKYSNRDEFVNCLNN